MRLETPQQFQRYLLLAEVFVLKFAAVALPPGAPGLAARPPPGSRGGDEPRMAVFELVLGTVLVRLLLLWETFLLDPYCLRSLGPRSILQPGFLHKHAQTALSVALMALGVLLHQMVFASPLLVIGAV